MRIYHTIKTIVNKHESIYPYLEAISLKANNLYNATLFRIRQVYTGLDKDPSVLTDNEKEIFHEIDHLLKVKTNFDRPTKEHPYMSYPFLYHLLYVNQNPDYLCSILPSQTGQQMIKNAVQNMKAYGKSVSDWKKHPDKYKRKPQLPRYKKSGGKSSYFFTNQQVRIKDRIYRFPLTDLTMNVPKCVKDDWRLKQVDVVPCPNSIVLNYVFEECRPIPEKPSNRRICAIDLGINNFVAMTNNAGLPGRLYKGGMLKHINHQYNQKMSRYMSEQTLQTKQKFKYTNRSRRWSRRRLQRMLDYMHKTAKDILLFCQENQMDTVVVGENIQWKQDLKKKKQMNVVQRQNFVQIPFDRFKDMLQYLCEWNGINFVLQEESYTSKASYLDNDKIPVYREGNTEEYTFSGIRAPSGIRRFYRRNNGMVINADLNGSANIGRKAFPELFTCSTETFFKIKVIRPEKENLHAAKKSAA